MDTIAPLLTAAAAWPKRAQGEAGDELSPESSSYSYGEFHGCGATRVLAGPTVERLQKGRLRLLVRFSAPSGLRKDCALLAAAALRRASNTISLTTRAATTIAMPTRNSTSMGAQATDTFSMSNATEKELGAAVDFRKRGQQYSCRAIVILVFPAESKV
jgi:hypothetical protein